MSSDVHGCASARTRYDVCISLSHTRGLAACAVGTACGVGLDAENCDAARLLALDGDWLTKTERTALQVLASTARAGAAVQLWTLKEAVAKAAGLGLHQRFGDVGFTLDPPRFARPLPAGTGYWWLAQMRPTPAHVLAVAVRSARWRSVRIAIEQLAPDTLGELAM